MEINSQHWFFGINTSIQIDRFYYLEFSESLLAYPPAPANIKKTTRFRTKEVRKRPYETKVFGIHPGRSKTSNMDVREEAAGEWPETCLRKILLFQEAGSFEDQNREVNQINQKNKPKPKAKNAYKKNTFAPEGRFIRKSKPRSQNNSPKKTIHYPSKQKPLYK